MSGYTKIVQTSVVYVTPIPSVMCNKQILSSPEWFGKFGKITYIHVNSKKRYAHIQFEDAYSAVNTVRIMNNAVYSNGCKLSVTYASIKYCNNFLLNNDCTITRCKYKHQWVNQQDIWVRSKSNFVCTVNLKTGHMVNELIYLFKCLGCSNSKQYIKYNCYSIQNVEKKGRIMWYCQCNVTLPFSTNSRGSDVLCSEASASKKQTAKNMASQKMIHSILQRTLPININVISYDGSTLYKGAHSRILQAIEAKQHNQQNNEQNNSEEFAFNESGSNTTTSMSPPKNIENRENRENRENVNFSKQINNLARIEEIVAVLNGCVDNLKNKGFRLKQQQMLIDQIKQQKLQNDKIVFVGDKHRKFGRLHGETFNDAIWHWLDVYQWIINVRNGKFSKYDKELSINLDNLNICGIKLFKMNKDNLKQIGIYDETDRILLIEEIKLLSNVYEKLLHHY